MGGSVGTRAAPPDAVSDKAEQPELDTEADDDDDDADATGAGAFQMLVSWSRTCAGLPSDFIPIAGYSSWLLSPKGTSHSYSEQ